MDALGRVAKSLASQQLRDGITIEGLSLLGVHEQSNRLYWDGREIEFRRIELGLYERVLATLGAAGAFGLFAVEVGKALGWWH
jgi:hypothetical protein